MESAEYSLDELLCQSLLLFRQYRFYDAPECGEKAFRILEEAHVWMGRTQECVDMAKWGCVIECLAQKYYIEDDTDAILEEIDAALVAHWKRIEKIHGKYSINSLVYWVTYVHNVVYSFYRSMIYCYINSTQRCAGSIVIDIIPTNGADKRKFFPFAPYFPVTNVIKRYFYPYFPAIIGIKGYSFPYFPYLSGIMKIKTALYSLFSRLDWHKTVVFPCLGEIYEGIRSLSWEIPVT